MSINNSDPEERVLSDRFNELTGPAGTTVQVLAISPHSLTTCLLVHHKLEVLQPNDPIVKIFGTNGKPPYFGNPGGGMEIDELVRFQTEQAKRYNHYQRTLKPHDLALVGAGLRETIDESGFDDIEIMTDRDDGSLIILNDYRYVNRHRVVTLWGQYGSYHQRPIREKDEIDHVAWVDFSLPMVEVFRRLRKELSSDLLVYPFWSHIRRSLVGFHNMDKYWRELSERPLQVSRLIHDSWKLCFPIGEGDIRFPKNGYRISPKDWYQMFDIMLDQGIENIDANVIYEVFREKIDRAKANEDRARGIGETIADNLNTDNIEGAEDYTGIRPTAEILQAEDEEYSRWLEQELGRR